MARLFDDTLSEYLRRETGIVTVAPCSISVWFKPNEDKRCSLVFLGDGNTNNEYFQAFIEDVANGQVVRALTRSVADGIDYAETTGTFTYNVWNHALVVFASASDRRVYLNGGNKGTNSTSITPAGIDRCSIGVQDAPSSDYYMSGDIAEVAIWDMALSDADAVSLAVNGTLASSIEVGNLISYWSLESDLVDSISSYNMTASGTVVSGHPWIKETPSVLALELNLQTPSAFSNQIVQVNVLNLELELRTPIIESNAFQVIVPDTLNLELTLQTPAVGIIQDSLVTPTTLNLELTLQTPIATAIINETVTVSALSLELSLLTPMIFPSNVSFDATTFTLSLNLRKPIAGAFFPTLSSSPRFEGFVDVYSSDGRQIDYYESGRPFVNSFFTFDEKSFAFYLRHVSNADKLLIESFYNNNKENEIFWQNEQNSTTYAVVFTHEPFCELDTEKDEHKIEIGFKQVAA